MTQPRNNWPAIEVDSAATFHDVAVLVSDLPSCAGLILCVRAGLRGEACMLPVRRKGVT